MMRYFNELEISFFLYMRRRFYSEYQIAAKLEMIKEIATSKDYYLPTMDGAISIVYRGQELLGKEYWDEIYTVDIDTPGLLKGKPAKTYLPVAGYLLSFYPQGERVKYELRFTKTRDKITKTSTLPLIPFVQKWDYMTYRLMRLAAFLNDKDEIGRDWESVGYGTEKWKDVIGVAKVNAIMRDDIIDVLTNRSYRR